MRSPSSFVLAFLALAATAPVAGAQADRDPVRDARWEAGLTPSLMKVSSALAGDHAWGIGLTLSGAWRFHRYVAAEASLLGAFAPQLNFKDKSTVNTWLPSLSIEGHPRPQSTFDPYVSLGVGHARFTHDEPPAGFPGSTSYSMLRGGLGVRYSMTSRLAWRAEFNRQFGSRGASPTLLSGVVFQFPDRLVQP